jgi:threonine dehydrogenase-like Zn-dependent dehydrogenase
MMMKAVIFDGQKNSIQEVPIPKVSDSQVLIKVKAVGICGTDFAITNGDLPIATPIILGHEFSGEIVKIGKDVDRSWLGTRVTSEINSHLDFECFYCQRGMYTQCISRKAIGIDINGALAEYIVVESYLIHEIPEKLSFEEATFIEPLAAAYQTFEMMPLNQDDKNVAIFGLGKLGLLILQVARSHDLNIMAVDGSELKLSLAKKLGAKHVINRFKVSNISEEIKKITNNFGADIVIDCTGVPKALDEIVASCRTRGKIHVKSTHGIETPINLTEIVVREITLYSSRCGPFELAIKGLKSGRIKVKDLITKIIPFEGVEAILTPKKLNRDIIKIVVKIED